MKLRNKTVLITGAARDIGRAIALQFSVEGARVLVHYFQSEEGARRTVSDIKTAGGEASMFCADLTKAVDVDRLKAFFLATFGDRLDILVNNSGGILGRKKLDDQDEAFYNEVMDVNFKSVFLVTRAFVPLMRPGSSIVNVSSQAARDGGGGGASLYAASKGAVTTYTRSLAKELGPSGIRVNAVCPGLITTTFHDKFTANDVREKVSAATPLRREGTPGEVASLVVFLGSDEALFITGANYDINGGLGFS